MRTHSNGRDTIYTPAESRPDFPQIEERILDYWRRNRTFERSVEMRPAQRDGQWNTFVFYDGPPFANGLPHYGHLATGFVKDIVPRYKTMRGYRVERRFGWDCHGLPAELDVEKRYGVSGRQQIQDYGIGHFNELCRQSVLRYTEDWKWYITRQARWVSFDNDYKTMDLSYMESVIWAFRKLWEKGLIYEDYRVVPYSWAVQTALSNFETRLDDSYRERDDPALTVAFQLHESPTAKPARLLAWTTTPWTLPSNLALCVHPDIDYAVLDTGESHWILAEAALARYADAVADYAQVQTIKGRDLVGCTYAPLFPYFRATENAFVVLEADFVNTDEGTGVVHIAPGFGQDDLDLARAHDIPVVVPVDSAGCFTDAVADYTGQNVVHEGNANIVRDLKARPEVLVKVESYRHHYPHCWRTDEPLIYRAINSWYVSVSQFRDRMVELNQGIHWVPEHIRDGLFGNWLANARDWNISRERFWGAPIPVWRCDDPNYPRVDVYGSLDEIECDFGVRPDDLHRPAIDELTRPNPDDPAGQATMRRVEDVLDCWFESGAMPFAQVHYPMENAEFFQHNFPGDFIVEYVAQTRGWFYTLIVLSTALFDCAPFHNCVCHGVVLDENYKKLSKRLRNYPDPVDVFNTYGADALRWYMMSSPLMTGGNLAMPQDGSDIGKSMRHVLLRFWNAYTFFTLYANTEGIRARRVTDAEHPLDRYLLAKTREMIELLQDRLDDYDIPGAYNPIPNYIDILNNWYIRHRRPQFWTSDGGAEQQAAFDTLYTVLCLYCQALAPLMPLIAERIYTGLTGEESVHLTDWPDADLLPNQPDFLAEMDLVREACSALMTLRERHQRRTRLPLRMARIAHKDADRLHDYADLIALAVNVKTVEFTTDVSSVGQLQLKVNPKLGARIGSKFKEVLAAQKSGDWEMTSDGRVAIASMNLDPQDFEVRVQAHDGSAVKPFDRWRGAVELDIEVYGQYQQEGWARDFVRLIQNARKLADLDISDRIRVEASIPDMMREPLEAYRAYVMKETLATALTLTDTPPQRQDAIRDDIEGHPVYIWLEKSVVPASTGISGE